MKTSTKKPKPTAPKLMYLAVPGHRAEQLVVVDIDGKTYFKKGSGWRPVILQVGEKLLSSKLAADQLADPKKRRRMFYFSSYPVPLVQEVTVRTDDYLSWVYSSDGRFIRHTRHDRGLYRTRPAALKAGRAEIQEQIDEASRRLKEAQAKLRGLK